MTHAEMEGGQQTGAFDLLPGHEVCDDGGHRLVTAGQGRGTEAWFGSEPETKA